MNALVKKNFLYYILFVVCSVFFLVNSSYANTNNYKKNQKTATKKTVNKKANKVANKNTNKTKDVLNTQPVISSTINNSNNINALVLMTDFGTKDGAVAAMKGVAVNIDRRIPIFDLTHEIDAYDIWEGANRLNQVVKFWPKGTVFVAVVDPGVGTKRKSVVLKTTTGHYFVGPDNGLFTLIYDNIGVEEMREIDEIKNRLPNSYDSYTFHGRDVFAYVGAKLSSGQLKFEDVGPAFEVKNLLLLEYSVAQNLKGSLVGTITALDSNYGNVWSNIPKELFEELKPEIGKKYRVKITNGDSVFFDENVPFYETFGAVEKGEPLLYINSLLEVAIALNMDSFADAYKIAYGPKWKITITPEYNTPYKSNPTPQVQD